MTAAIRCSVSFELGTDPDINAVNVNNRVQVALSKLPQDVQRQGVTVKKKSSALLGVLASIPRPSARTTRCSSRTTRRSTCSTGSRASPGVGDAALWGPQDYAMRAWVQDSTSSPGSTSPPATSSTPSRRRTCRPRSGASARGRSPTTSSCSSHPDQGPARQAPSNSPNIILRTNPDGSVLRLGDVARARARRRQSRPRDAAQRRSGGGDRALPVARRQCDRDA